LIDLDLDTFKYNERNHKNIWREINRKFHFPELQDEMEFKFVDKNKKFDGAISMKVDLF
jgi:hypothetical protein